MRKLMWLLLLLLFAGFIFYNSSLPAAQSDGASRLLAGYVAKLLALLPGDVMEGTGDLNHTLRKLAHFFEFYMLGLILCNTYAAYGAGRKLAAGYVFFLGLAVAVVDEYIQLFSPGRASMVRDVLLDFSGVFVGWLSYQVWQWSKH